LQAVVVLLRLTYDDLRAISESSNIVLFDLQKLTTPECLQFAKEAIRQYATASGWVAGSRARWGKRALLGVLYAALGAFTFALNNVNMRRGVVTGSVLQGMAMTVPIGGLPSSS
jgi:ATP-dependent protease HslVU (ClpYQ) ATPase subunit